MRCSMACKLLMKRVGRPVEMNILTPLACAFSNASMVEAGMLWVLKLTSVPSMSKNRAFVMLLVYFLFCTCKITKKILLFKISQLLKVLIAVFPCLHQPCSLETEPYFSFSFFILDKKMFLFHFLLLPLLVLHFFAHKAQA